MTVRFTCDPSRHPAVRQRLVASLLNIDDAEGNALGRREKLSRRLKREDETILHPQATALIGEVGEGAEVRRLEPARAVVRWYVRGRIGLEELFLQLYYGSLSLAEIEGVVDSLWGDVGGTGLIREVTPGIVERVTRWLERPIERELPYVMLQWVDHKVRGGAQAGRLRAVAAVGISACGQRTGLGISVRPVGRDGVDESGAVLLEELVARGLPAPRLVLGDWECGLRAAVERRWKGCVTLGDHDELEKLLAQSVGSPALPGVHEFLRQWRDCRIRSEAENLWQVFSSRLAMVGNSLAPEAANRLLRSARALDIPRAHWHRLVRANLIPRELNRVREQARVLGPVADPKIFRLMAAAALRQAERTAWLNKPFLQREVPAMLPTPPRAGLLSAAGATRCQ